MNRTICPFCELINFSSDQFCKKCKKELSVNPMSAKAYLVNQEQPKSLGEILFKNKMSIMAKVILFSSIGFTILTLITGLFYRHLIKEGEFAALAMFFGVIPFFCGLGVVQLITQKKVDVYERGFVYKYKKEVFVVFWKEIKSCVESIEWIFVEGIPAGRGRSLKIITFSGEEFVLNQEIGGLGKMINFIKNKTANAKYQKNSKTTIINN